MKPRGSHRRKNMPEPHAEEIALRLTVYGQDAIDLRRLAEAAGKSASALAKSMLCEVLADDRAAHHEPGRAA
jgi:hypothetical protein